MLCLFAAQLARRETQTFFVCVFAYHFRDVIFTNHSMSQSRRFDIIKKLFLVMVHILSMEMTLAEFNSPICIPKEALRYLP